MNDFLIEHPGLDWSSLAWLWVVPAMATVLLARRKRLSIRTWTVAGILLGPAALLAVILWSADESLSPQDAEAKARRGRRQAGVGLLILVVTCGAVPLLVSVMTLIADPVNTEAGIIAAVVTLLLAYAAWLLRTSRER